ncbi:MAG: sodium:solute symporter, partial [Flavobacteriaceae bacterium]|nr:sodium:solute symporter [Flavobacteriaceae bacterium]
MLDFSAYLIITIYLLVLFYLGFFFSKKQKSINDYFNGGQRIPSWAAGLSIFGTVLSPITFLAIPAKTYATDWSYFIFNISILIITPIIVFFFLPTYRKLNISTAYEFLEKRFDLSIRLIGAFCFILFQIGRIGIVLFLPSLVLNLVLDLNIFFCIMTMGFISLFYTYIGGIEAVIWTDVIQVFVLLTGIVVSVLYLFNLVDGGLFEIIKLAKGENKFNIIDFSFSLKQPTLWVVLLGGLFTNISTYGTDQTIVQRY